MKDVAYFIGSCLKDDQCERREAQLLASYFGELKEALRRRGSPVKGEDVEREWRPLYPVAWTDFHRFLKGWSPGHWKIHSYSEKLARNVVEQLTGTTSDISIRMRAAALGTGPTEMSTESSIRMD